MGASTGPVLFVGQDGKLRQDPFNLYYDTTTHRLSVSSILWLFDGSVQVSSPAAGGGGGGSPGGSDTQVQYNNSGSFAGSSGLTWTDSSKTLEVMNTGSSPPSLSLFQNNSSPNPNTTTSIFFNSNTSVFGSPVKGIYGEIDVTPKATLATNHRSNMAFKVVSGGTGTQSTGLTLQGASSGTLPPDAIFPGLLFAGSGARQITTAAGNLDAAQLVNLVPNDSVDTASVTKSGPLIAGNNVTLTPGANGTTIDVAAGADAILNQDHLQADATGYPDFLYVGTSETVLGNFEVDGNALFSGVGGPGQIVFTSDPDETITSNGELSWDNGNGALNVGGAGGVAAVNAYSAAAGREAAIDNASFGMTAALHDFRNSSGVSVASVTAEGAVRTSSNVFMGGVLTAGTGRHQITTTTGLIDSGNLTGALPVSVLASSFPVTGTTAGQYPLATVTVNPQGQVVAVASGTANSGGGYAVEPATVTFNLAKGVKTSTETITGLAAGVMHVVAASSDVAVGLVSLATETTGSYVANVNTSAPLTGGSAGSAGASLTLGVDPSSVTLQGNTFNGASQLLHLNGSSLIPNANVDGSSVTKQGNAFNGANQLAQLNASGFIPNANIDPSSATMFGANVIKLTSTLQSPSTFFVSSGTVAGNFYASSITIGVPLALTNAPLNVQQSANGTVQINVQNTSTGALSSSDFVATSNLGSGTSFFLDAGINGSSNTDSSFTVAAASDSYLYASNRCLAIGTAENVAGSSLTFFTGGTLSSNIRASFDNSGNFSLKGLSPGVAHIVATSSNVVTNLVSLSTEVVGTLPSANIATTGTSVGSFTLATVGVNAQGQVISISSGTGGAGDAVLASTQTWTGINTYNSSSSYVNVASVTYTGVDVVLSTASKLYVNGPIADGTGSFGTTGYMLTSGGGPTGFCRWSIAPTYGYIKTSSATTVASLVNAPTAMSFPVVSGSTYVFSYTLDVGCNNTGGIKVGISGPAGTVVAKTFGNGSATAVVVGRISATATASAAYNTTSAQTGTIWFYGSFAATAAGTVQLQFQSTTATQTSTIYEGSEMWVYQVP